MLMLVMRRMDQLPRLVHFHLILLGGIPPVVTFMGEFALIPQLVHAQLVAIGVHAHDHGGWVFGSFEDGIDGDGVAEGYSAFGGRRVIVLTAAAAAAAAGGGGSTMGFLAAFGRSG